MKDKINVAELLKDCPRGMELDCYLFNGLEFDHIDTDNEEYPIVCRVKSSKGGYNTHAFTKYGWYNFSYDYSKCVIFPKGKTTWEGFQRPFKDGDIITSVYQGVIQGTGILQPYNEQETMDKVNKAVFDANAQCCDIMNHLIKEETMEEPTIRLAPEQLGGAQIIIPIPKGYEFAGVDDNNQQVVFEKIKPKYPKTYEECCDVLELDDDERYINVNITNIETLENKKFEAFIRLIRCRDAYWKLAGEQMGLDKPWEPDYIDESYEQGSPTKYVIYYTGTYITKGVKCTPSHILAFPTEEMRDAFCENFKSLIEECKELL